MEINTEFDPIRPFNDSEVPEAIERLISNKDFYKVSNFFLPGKSLEEVQKTIRQVKTVEQFQSQFSNSFLEYIVNTTSDGLSSSGIEDIKGKGHLYIANHRDIILDTAFLQSLLQKNGIATTEITVGDNLMKNTLFSVLGKLNKVFTLYRGGGRIQMYKNAILHSKYIHNVIRERNESLWIAQRDGRTKDGNDKTQQGLLKMLLGDRRDVSRALEELAIVPVSTSYELEPCLKGKVRETYITKTTGEYTKSENEDMHSVATSVLAPKGRIHIGFGKRLNLIFKDIDEKELSNNEIIDQFVQEIDTQIYKNYKLWPYNYLAWDIVNNSQKFSEHYTSEDKIKFEAFIKDNIKDIDGDASELNSIALNIYANPVQNKLNLD